MIAVSRFRCILQKRGAPSCFEWNIVMTFWPRRIPPVFICGIMLAAFIRPPHCIRCACRSIECFFRCGIRMGNAIISGTAAEPAFWNRAGFTLFPLSMLRKFIWTKICISCQSKAVWRYVRERNSFRIALPCRCCLLRRSCRYC